MESKIMAHLHLNSEKDGEGRISESSLVHALRNVRLITGRDQETGVVKPDAYWGNWIGAIGYITILDQIGKCYRPSSKQKIKDSKMSPIKKALFNFTNLSKDEVNAIYALRNAFHHDFSLLNLDENAKKPRSNYIHHFAIESQIDKPIVKLPTKKWDRDINNRNNDNVTYINLRALGDLVESIYKELIRLNSLEELELDLDGGETELEARYIFYH